jgi:hypothetical protein
MGSLKKKTRNIGLKPITNSTKQVMQGDGEKLGRTLNLKEAFLAATIT